MKYLFLIVFCLCISSILSAQTPVNSDTLNIAERLHLADSLFGEQGNYHQALDYYQQLSVDFAQRGDLKSSITTQVKVIQCHYLLSRYDTALRMADEVLKSVPKNLPEKFLFEGTIQTLIGEIYYKKGEYKVAKQKLAIALEVLKYEPGAEVPLSTAYTVMGFVHETLEAFDLAFKYYKKALRLRRRVLGKYNPATASSYADLANLYFAKGEYTTSISYDLEALRIKKQLYGEHHPAIALSYNNIASTYSTRGNYDKALNYHQRALAIRKKVFGKLHLDVGESYNNIGYTYMQKGAYDLALEYYQRYRAILQKLVGKHHPNLSSVYTNIGTVYVKKRQYSKAINYFDKNLWLLRSAYAKHNMHFAEAYHNYAYVHRLKKDYRLALAYSEKTLAIMQEVFAKPHMYTARAYLNMGRVYAESERPKLAIEYFEKAIYALQQVFGQQSSLLSISAYELGKLYLEQGNYKAALPHLHQALVYGVPRFDQIDSLYALPQLKDCLLDPFLVKILAAKARCLYQMSDSPTQEQYLHYAIDTYELGYVLLKKIGNAYLKVEDRMNFNETIVDIRDGALRAYRKRYEVTQEYQYLRKMFEYSEQFKANTLQSSLNHQKALKAVNIPAVYIMQEQGLRMDIHRWQKKISEQPQHAAQHQDSLFEYNRRYEELIAALETNYPQYVVLKYGYRVAELKEIQRKLPEKSVLLEYSLGDKGSYMFVMTKAQVKVVSLINRQQLQPLFNAFYNALEGEKKLPTFAKASYQLYEAMLKPAEAYIKDKNQLIIIAPSLESTPFEAIISQLPTAQEVASGRFDQLAYLVRQYQISYHYSATLWLRNLGQKSIKKPSLVAFAPFSTGKAQVLKSNTRQVSDSLPESGVEVKRIFEMFRQKELIANAYLSASATKRCFLKKAPHYNIVHLASHSEANTQNANLAKVKFAAEGTSANKFSSFLYSSEVYNLKLNADLLVLSSCESGVGKLARGEGVLSLARSFLYAGARNIVFSLWEVNDTYTRKLMVAFYKELLAGKSYRAALQAAQQTNLQADRFLHPKHWAGFVMVGE